MDKQQISKLKSMFDEIAHTADDGTEFWYARELQGLLGYVKWDKFKNVIAKAKISCLNSGIDEKDHFLQVGKIVAAGISQKDIGDIMLTRYACYLIAQNGDSTSV